MRNRKIYIPWTLAAIRRVQRCDRQSNFNRNVRLIHLASYLQFCQCTLQWDPQRRSPVVVPNTPRPYPDKR